MNKTLIKTTIEKERYPLTIALSSGDKFLVRHPENIVVKEPRGQEMAIVILEKGGVYILEPQDVVSVGTTRRNGRKL